MSLLREFIGRVKRARAQSESLPTWDELWGPVGWLWKQLWKAIQDWRQGRDLRRLRIGLPALLAGALWLVFAALLVGWTPERIETRYTESAKRALAARHYEEACLAYERLLQTDPKPDASHIFGLASSLQGLGQKEEATALLAGIAPPNASGYAPAHLALAQAILASPSPDPNLLTAAELHLTWVVRAEPRNLEARMLLGGLYMQTHQWAQAREQLLKAFQERKEAALLLAGVAAAQEDEPEARKWAQEAQAAFKAQVNANPGAVLARVRCAQATLLLGQYAEALGVLNAGNALYGDRTCREMASRVCEAWAREVARESPADLGTRLSLIQRGLEYAPQNRELLLDLIALSHLSGKEADAARDRLNALLAAGGQDSAILHFCLGGDAWGRGHLEEGRQHFMLAYDLAPQMPYIANNMAMMLALGNPPDLPRALVIVQSLADKFPNDPHVLDSRGQILIKMGKWPEGVKCLELALPSLASKTAAHLALADAYQHLGLGELAEEHQRLAKGP